MKIFFPFHHSLKRILALTTLVIFILNIPIHEVDAKFRCSLGAGEADYGFHFQFLISCKDSKVDSHGLSLDLKGPNKGLYFFFFDTESSFFFKKSPFLGPLTRRIIAFLADDPNQLEEDLYEISEHEITEAIPELECWKSVESDPANCGLIPLTTPQSDPAGLSEAKNLIKNKSYTMVIQKPLAIFGDPKLRKRKYRLADFPPDPVIVSVKKQKLYQLRKLRDQERQDRLTNFHTASEEILPDFTTRNR